MEGKDGKTEKPTPRRRSKARKEGQLAKSQEVNTVIVTILALIGIGWGVPHMGEKLGRLLELLLQYHVGEAWSTELIRELFIGMCFFMGALTAPIMVPIMLGALTSNILQTKPYFSMDPLKWKLSGLSPMKGLQQLFSAQSLVTFATSMMKVTLVAGVIFIMMKSRVRQLVSLQYMEVGASAIYIFRTILYMAWVVTILSIIIAVIDWIYQNRKHEKSLMMTKEEVKEERKSQEPNPLMKRAQMRKMRELTMLRMMAAIPDSTVVITNPTHVAVVLHYDPETMKAPKVVAKGLRLVAERIKRIARENNVPVLEKPALARSLYKEVKIGREVPSQFYGTIAEVLAYLYKIGNDHIRSKLTSGKAA